MSTPVDYDSEDVQLSARTDDVVMYLPEITYLDTQPWSVEIGLTPERLVQLRDALDSHLRGADHAGAANRGEDATVPLRDRLRLALRRHISADDDTMPALCFGGFLRVPADDVLDNLIKAVEQP
ncbi:hypothetical protein [Streptomyces griseus]|uniref:hypothetical protein n=1 Tax=Streptomyces griseus TaxID=1911 RepID=UPI0033A27B57